MPKQNDRDEGDEDQADAIEAPALKRRSPLRNVGKGRNGKFKRAPTKTKKTRQALIATDLELQDR
jgi:hypothetical protein